MTTNGNSHSEPQWLTKLYLERLLQNNKKDSNLRIEKLEIAPAIPKGENYASVMKRMKIGYESKGKIHHVSYLVKTCFENDPYIVEIYKPYQVFKTEMEMYNNVLPKLAGLLKKIGDKDKLFAETIHVDYENEAIMFEDLSVDDFCLTDRLKGMDMVHTKLALKKLAKMHATAAVLNEQSNGSLQTFNRGIFNRHTRGFGCFFENLIGVCAEFADTCPELGPYYKEKLLKLRDHVVEYGTRQFDLQEGHFHTLIHGDFWVNNVMLRYEPSKEHENKIIKDLMIIDFQFCAWTSPTVDLHYFFNTSLESSLRLNAQDELVQYYHGILYETLSLLHYAGHKPSLHEFWVQMEETRFFAVTSALVVQTFMINDQTEDADIQALLMSDERAQKFHKMLYQNKKVQDNVKYLLPYFDRRGLLDVTD